MPIEFACECGQMLRARAEDAGRVVECPDCGTEQDVPWDDRDATAGVPEGTSGKARTGLALGLVSLLPVINLLTFIPAIIVSVSALREIRTSRGRLRGTGLAVGGLVTTGIGLLLLLFLIPLTIIGLLVPAVQKVQVMAERVQGANNLKQIGLALVNHEAAMGRLPAASLNDATGKPALSWRVSILPYLGYDQLYRQFHLDEPWDSPHNHSLLSQMPPVYRAPGTANMTANTTPYRVFVGPGTPMGDNQPLGMKGIGDGPSATLLVVECQDQVPWTKPDELPFDPKARLTVLGVRPDGLQAVMCDGGVRFLRTGTPEDALKAAVTANGKESVPLP